MHPPDYTPTPPGEEYSPTRRLADQLGLPKVPPDPDPDLDQCEVCDRPGGLRRWGSVSTSPLAHPNCVPRHWHRLGCQRRRRLGCCSCDDLDLELELATW